MDNQSLFDRAQRVFTPNYGPPPLVVERGEGMYVFDVEGNRYLDMVSGIAVSSLGHQHPALTKALMEQVQRILHVSNLYLNEPAIRLAERLVEHTFGDRVLFCNSGAEAAEAALKLARRYAHDRGDATRNRIVSFVGGFHGRTYGALSATAQPKYHVGFGPMPEGFDYIELGDLDALGKIVSDKTAAVIVEPIQGEGGVNVPPDGFLQACRSVCDAAGALLIFDEVQTGMGRTGHTFAHQAHNVVPDIMTVAKGIGAGLPIGGIVAKEEVGKSLVRGTHGSTYAGNPVACTAANVVFDHLEKPEFMANVQSSSEHLMAGLRAIQAETGAFSAVRGQGLLVGAELAPDVGFTPKQVVEGCRKHNVLIHVAGPRVVRFLPPLVVKTEHIDEAMTAVSAAVRELS